ncbi:MAG: manganese efflux pump MntP family protein [Candidatus Anaerobiospirillum pullicola]|uniref:Putative manganese efflux pump MntP n=1 Tax=Candidatus Anaerobiospirillum pullicola TaxID=2838451 RepID=A0A948WZY9_9GAMM|nr:manganese efflux pump MntP family protein [Candidatus Anaerobiospirillum pullicola]
MSWLEVVGIALALSVDAFVCSVISGKRRLNSRARLYTAMAVAFAFGLFQFLMPVIGFFAGVAIQKYFAAYDHWVAFGLLAIVAINMLKEAFFAKDEDGDSKCACNDPATQQTIKHEHLVQIGLFTLLAMAVGTSIDALAVGVSYGLLQGTILWAAAIIGVICASCSFTGFFLGQALTRFAKMDPVLNVAGAVVLLGIGVHILLEHQAFA